MRIFVRIALMLLMAYLFQSWLMPSEMQQRALDVLPRADATGPAFIAVMCALALLAGYMCLLGGFGIGFGTLLLGGMGALLAVGIVNLSDTWISALHVPAYLLLAAGYGAAILYAAFLGTFPTFRRGKLQIRDGGDHLSVDKGDGQVTVLRSGRVLCAQTAETRSETRVGGGSYVAPTTSTVTTYGPNGVNYGTAYGTQIVHAPTFTYEKSYKTGFTDFRLEEVGPDHDLLIATHPKHVQVHARHSRQHREKSAWFSLGAWASFRFAMWRRFHPKAFFRKDAGLPRRIAKAVSNHLSKMKQLYGKTSDRELIIDHELALISFVGLAKEKVFVHLTQPTVSVTIGKQDAGTYWSHGSIRISGNARTITPPKKIASRLSEWVQLQALRGG